MRWKHRNYIAVFGRYFKKTRTRKITLTILLYTLAQHVSHISVIPTEGYASKGNNLKRKSGSESTAEQGRWKMNDLRLTEMIGKEYLHCGW